MTTTIQAAERATAGDPRGWCGVLAGPVFVIVVVVLTAVEWRFLHSAGWSLHNANGIPFPSYTARGPYGFVQTANFLLTGALVITFVTALGRLLPRRAGATARVLLTAVGVALCTSAFTTDRVPGPVSWHGVIHAISFGVLVVGSVAGLLFSGLALRNVASWRTWGNVTAVLAPWQVVVLAAGGALLPGDTAFYVFLVTVFAWMTATGLRLLRPASSAERSRS